MELTEARVIVKEFCSRWTDQKLAEVLAFAEDGKMSYWMKCQCLLGVTLAFNLHTNECIREVCSQENGCDHYILAENLPGAKEAEEAYLHLGRGGFGEEMQPQRDIEFIAILRELIAERDGTNTIISGELVSECPIHT